MLIIGAEFLGIGQKKSEFQEALSDSEVDPSP